MTNKQELLILAAAAAVMFAIAPYAFADSLNQSGAGNVAQQDVGNIIGNGNNSPGSNSPHLNANADAQAKAQANAAALGVGIGKGGDAKATGGKATANTGPVSVDAPVNIGGTKVPRQAPGMGGMFGQVSGNVVSCSNSVGGGLVAPIGGIQFNGSDTDRNCQRILLSREIMRHGKHPGEYEDASVGLLCRDDELRQEMAKAGTPCPADRHNAAAASPDAAALAYAGPTVDRSHYPSNTRNGW